MIINKTNTIKKDKDKYTNNLETKQITKNDETLLPYCIIATNEEDKDVLTVQCGNTITTINIVDHQYEDILRKLTTKKKNEKPKQKKTSKTIIKGKKQENKKGDK